MAQPGPPPPPPVPGQRGPMPQGAPFRPQGPGPNGPQQQRPMGPPQGFPMNMPIRQQSNRIVDVTPQRPPKLLDAATCRKNLTTYSAFTLRKASPNDPKCKPSWARSEVNDERLSQEDIIREIKRLGEKGKSVTEKKAALAPNQGNQVGHLLDDLIAREPDRNFEWTLAQIDRIEKTNKQGKKETATMTLFFKRSPLKELDPIMLHQNIERMRHERMMAQNRPPQPQPQPQPAPQQLPIQLPIQLPQRPQGGQGPPPPGAHQVFKVERKQSKSNLPPMKKDQRSAKKYHSDSSSDSSYDSDEDSRSDISSSLDTSISSRSRENRKYKGKSRIRSYSRHREPREHRKKYYIDGRAFSPEGPMYRDAAQSRYSVPDVPRSLPAAIPGFDPVAAAYQAGKIDADAERFSMERERELERERYAPPPRPLPLLIERPVVIDRQLSIDRIEPRAIVSYGRPEPRRFDTMPARPYHDSGPHYVDERYIDDLRSPRDEEIFVRHGREAEAYIDTDRRRPHEFLERRRTGDYVDRHEPRVVYRESHPFAPRRTYPDSVGSSGW